ncbi:unnamed protein product, partial [Schistosoma mattheei]
MQSDDFPNGFDRNPLLIMMLLAAHDEREHAQKCYEEKLNKVEKHRNQILKEKERNMITAHYERARKVRQVLERRKQLRKMIEEYRKELYEAREQSIQRAMERVSCRLSEEQKRLASERRQKQMQVEENTKEPAPMNPPDIESAHTDLPIDVSPPTTEEIRMAIRQIKSKKAAEPDNIPAEALKSDIE